MSSTAHLVTRRQTCGRCGGDGLEVAAIAEPARECPGCWGRGYIEDKVPLDEAKEALWRQAADVQADPEPPAYPGGHLYYYEGATPPWQGGEAHTGYVVTAERTGLAGLQRLVRRRLGVPVDLHESSCRYLGETR